jgi:hypothetical protein
MSSAAMAARAPRHSGLQLQVLALFRSALRVAAQMSKGAEPHHGSSASAAAKAYVRAEFREKAARVDRLDFQRIEWLLRQGRKRVDTASMPGVSGFNTVPRGSRGPGDGAGAGAARHAAERR